MLDVSMEEQILLNSEDDEDINIFATLAVMMRRDLHRNEGFCEITVPSYSIDEFQSHFRMTRSTMEALWRDWLEEQEEFQSVMHLEGNQFLCRSRFWPLCGLSPTRKQYGRCPTGSSDRRAVLETRTSVNGTAHFGPTVRTGQCDPPQKVVLFSRKFSTRTGPDRSI